VLNSLIFEQLSQLYAQAGLPVSAQLPDILKIMTDCLAPSSWASYISAFKKFVRFCESRGYSPLPASPAVVLEYALHLAQEGSVRADASQTYFSAINTFHELVGYPKPALGSELTRFRAGWSRSLVLLAPVNPLSDPTKVPCIPASVVKTLYLSLDHLSQGSQEWEDALYVVLAFRVFLRPSTLVSIWWSEVLNLPGRITLRFLARDWKDASGKLNRSARMPVVDLTELPALGVAVAAAVAATGGSRLFTFDTVESAGHAFRRAVGRVDSALAASLTQYSCRRGGASAARAAGVPLDVIEGVGGWAANSTAMRQHYLDRSVPGCPDALFFFKALLPGSGTAQFGAPIFH
jgi:hypothetical protein